MTFRQTVLAIVGIGVLVALATAASADDRPIDWKPAIAAAIGQAADATSTLRFLSNGSPCVEGNALYGSHPSAARLLAVKAPTIATAAFLAWYAGRPNSAPWTRRFSRVFGYSAGFAGGAVAVVNIRACGF